MAADEPPYLTVGTDVSAKYKGAFCEAKVKKVNRLVKCKVNFKNNQGTAIVTDDQIKGTLRVGAHVEAKHPDKNQPMEAVISKLFDYSQYTVVFDDGDETTLRRTSLCLKSGRHFAESETLDQLPLTNPEHFGTPVMGSKTKRKRRSATTAVAVMNFQRARRAHSGPLFASLCRDEESSDEDPPPKKTKDMKTRERDPDIGKVVCVEVGDKRRKDSWFPGLVVSPTAQESIKICLKEDYLVRSFKDGKYYPTLKKDTREFTKEIGSKIDSTMLKTAVEKALQYLDNDELPPHWDRDLLMGLNVPSTAEVTDTDSDTSDDEPSEEKDRFVAQLYKFMDERGTPINKAPTVGNRDLNLYKLFKLVSKMGGYNRVTNQNQWKTVYTKMGLPALNPSSSHQIKQAYKKYLHSFEDFYRKLGCTMVTNIRSSRVRHRSDRNFIITRNRDREVGGPRNKQSKEVKDKNKSDEKDKDNEEEESKSDDEEETNEESEQQDQETHPAEEEKDENEKEQKLLSSFEKDDKENEKNDADMVNEAGEEEGQVKMPEVKKEKVDILDNKDLKVPFELEEPEVEVKNEKIEKVQKDKEKVLKVKDKGTKDKEKTDWKMNRKERKVIKEKDEKKKVKKEVEDKDKKAKDKKENQKKERREVEKRERRDKAVDKKEQESLNQEGSEKQESTKHRGKNADAKKEERNVRSKARRDGSPMLKKQLKRLSSKTDDRSFDSKSSNDDASDKNDSCSSPEKSDKGEKSEKSKNERSEKVERDISSVQIGDRVRVRYGARKQQKIYEAKVVKMDEERGFYVHYTGWNMRYDEWVKRSRIVEIVTDKAVIGKKKKKQGVGVVTKSLQVNRVFKRGRTASIPNVKTSGNKHIANQQTEERISRKSSIRSSSPSPATKSRSMRSDRNSLSESPFASGLEPRKRIRRKSGVSASNQDSFQSLENYSEPGASDTEDTSKDGLQPDDDDNISDDRSSSTQPSSETKEESSKKNGESDDSTEEESTTAIPDLEMEGGITEEKEVVDKEDDEVLPPPVVLPEETSSVFRIVDEVKKEVPEQKSVPVDHVIATQDDGDAIDEKMPEEIEDNVFDVPAEAPATKDEEVEETPVVSIDSVEDDTPVENVPEPVGDTEAVEVKAEVNDSQEQVHFESVNIIQQEECIKEDAAKNEDLLSKQNRVVVPDQMLTIMPTNEESQAELAKMNSTTDEDIYNELIEINKKLGMNKESEENYDDDDVNEETSSSNKLPISEPLTIAPSLTAVAEIQNEPEILEEEIQEEEEFPLLVMDSSKIAQVQEEINAEGPLMSPLSNEESLEIQSTDEHEKDAETEAVVEKDEVESKPAEEHLEELPNEVEVKEEASISVEKEEVVNDFEAPPAKIWEEVSSHVVEEDLLAVSIEEQASTAESPEKKEQTKDQNAVKKEGKKEKKLKANKEKKHSAETPSDKQDSKKTVKHRMKRKIKIDGDGDGNKDEAKVKVKKAKKFKSKKLDPKLDSEDERDIEIEIEKLKKKDKKKKEEKKISKIQSDGEKDETKKEKKKARKNRERAVLTDKKRDDSLEKRAKKKKKLHLESDMDVDVDKEVAYLSTENSSKISKKEKKKDKKKLKEIENLPDDDASNHTPQKESSSHTPQKSPNVKQVKSVVGHYSPVPLASVGAEEKSEYDQDASFLLCEEKVPASPVPEEMLVEFTDQPPVLSFANTVKSQSSSNQGGSLLPSSSSNNSLGESSNLSFQPETLGHMAEAVARHESEVSSVLDNTPPTTPESTESVASSSPPHEEQNERQSVQDVRSSGDSTEEESYIQQERQVAIDVMESEDGSSRTESTVSSSSIVHDKSKDSLNKSSNSLKRHKSDGEEGVHKKRRSRKRTHSSSEGSKNSTRHRNNSSRSAKDDDYSNAQSENSCSETMTNNPLCPNNNSPGSITALMPTRPSKFNFCIPLDEYADADKRIALLQERLAELRKTYMALKAEVALIDRRRKKAKKKEKETAAVTLTSVSAGSHAVEVHCAS